MSSHMSNPSSLPDHGFELELPQNNLRPESFSHVLIAMDGVLKACFTAQKLFSLTVVQL